MADVKQDVILSFNADTGGVDKQVEQLTRAVEELAGVVDTMGSEFKANTEALDASLEQTGKQAKETAKDVEQVGKSAKKGGSFFKEFGDLGEQALGPLDDLTGGLASQFVGAFGGVKKLAGGMKILKLAIASTGIGLLVVALGSVATALAQNEGFMKKLRKGMLWMEPLFKLLKDTITGFGNAIIDAFSKPGEYVESAKQAILDFGNAIKEFVLERINMIIDGLGLMAGAIKKLFAGDFEGALSDAGEGFVKFQRGANIAVIGAELYVAGMEKAVDATGKAIDAVGDWVESTSKVVDSLDALDTATERNAKQQEELAFNTKMNALANADLKRAVDDTSLSFDERLAIAKKVANQEKAFADAQVRLNEKAVANAQEQIRLRGADEENLKRLRDAQLALAESRAQSLEVEAQAQQTIQGIEGERLAQQEQIAQMQEGWTAQKLEGIDAEKQAVKDQLEADLQAIDQLNLEETEKEALRAQARQASNNRLAEIDDKYLQQELKAQQDLEDELFMLQQTAEDKEIMQALQAYDKRVAIAGDDEGLLKMATEQLNKELADVNAKYRDAEAKADEQANEKRLEQEKELQGQIVQARDQAIQAFADLSEAFGGISVEQERQRAEREQAIQDETYQNGVRLMDLENQIANEQDAEKKAKLEAQLAEEKYASELRVYNLELENYRKNKDLDEQARKQFKIQKGVSIAQTTIAQSESAVQAYKSLVGIPVYGPALATAAAAAAIASGAKQIQAIRKQTYKSTAGQAPKPPQKPASSGLGGAGGAGAVGGGGTAPQLDLSFLGEGAGTSQPIQAYVIAEDVSNAQQATQKIEDQATL